MLTPDGKTYVMQAYSHIVDDSLTMQSLAALGGQLQKAGNTGHAPQTRS